MDNYDAEFLSLSATDHIPMTRGLQNGELCEYRGILESHLKVCSAQVLYEVSSITLQYAATLLDLDREP